MGFKIKIKPPKISSIFGGPLGMAANALGLDQVKSNIQSVFNPQLGGIQMGNSFIQGIGLKSPINAVTEPVDAALGQTGLGIQATPAFSGGLGGMVGAGLAGLVNPANPNMDGAQGGEMPAAPDRAAVVDDVNAKLREDAKARRASRTLFTSSAGLLGNRARTSSASSTLLGV